MANEGNLIPQAHKLTVEEASKGGKNSGKSRLAKKRGRELLRAMLEMPETDARLIAEIKAFGIVDDADITNEVVMNARQIKRAKMKSDTKAYNAVMKGAGFQEEDNVQQSTFIINTNQEGAEHLASIREKLLASVKRPDIDETEEE